VICNRGENREFEALDIIILYKLMFYLTYPHLSSLIDYFYQGSHGYYKVNYSVFASDAVPVIILSTLSDFILNKEYQCQIFFLKISL